MSALDDLLGRQRLICTVGSGGVGKTTCAAMLGLLASTMGRRALVLTIDPARRLMSALGLQDAGGQARELLVDELQDLGIPARQPLGVKMLQLKVAWDDMVQRVAPSPEVAGAILSNRFYSYLSTELPGAQEYIACEQVYTMAFEQDYDLVILDTPPTTNALDFLEAPERILAILNHEAVRWAARPALQASKLSMKLFELASGAAMQALEKVAGVELLKELGEFLILFESLFDPLRERTTAVQQLLASRDTSFVLVAAPEQGPLRQARFFLDKLTAMRLPVGGILLNRMIAAPSQPAREEALRDALADVLEAEAKEKLVAATLEASGDLRRQARQQQLAVLPLRQVAGAAPVWDLPRLPGDISDLGGAWALARRLRASAGGDAVR